MASRTSSIAPTNGNLSQYLQEIRKYPMLSSEEEDRLARAWRATKDEKSAHMLVSSHLRLVAKIAMGYRGYGLPLGDLISEGNVGLIQAIQRFDPDRGFRVTTYAIWWIRAAIQEYILHSWSLVKMGTTAAQKKLFFNLRRLKGKMQAIEDGDMKPEQVAEVAHVLGVPELDVVSMNRRLASPDNSLNAPIRTDSEGQWQDFLIDDQESQEDILSSQEEITGRRSMLAVALKTLNNRERHILIGRRLQETPSTLEELAHIYRISRERVRQIEGRAFEKLQVSMRKQVAERRVAERRAVLARNGTILIDLAPAATSGLSSRCNSRQTVRRNNKAFV
jgi:RNA polymerase sigma-32 factor